MKMNTRKILLYCLSILIPSWILQIVAIYTTGDIDSPGAEGWLVATMFTPLLATIVFLILNKDMRKKLLWKPDSGIIVAAVLAIVIPILIAFAVLGIISSFHLGSSGWFRFSMQNVNISGGPFLLGTGNQHWFLFIANMFVTGIVYSLMNAIPAAGEEITWRGLVQGLLVEKFGLTKGIIVLGVFWSFWHLPAQLAGYNFPENPVVGSFIISPIELTAVSFFLAWLTFKSKSFIPAAIAHGAGNSIQEGIVSNIQLTTPNIYEHVISMFVTIAAGLIFLLALRLKPQNAQVISRK